MKNTLKELIKKNNEEFDEIFGSLWSGMKIVGGEDQQKERWGVVRKENIKDFLSKSQHSLLNNILEYIEGEKKEIERQLKEFQNDPLHPVRVSLVSKRDALQLIEDYITEALTK